MKLLVRLCAGLILLVFVYLGAAVAGAVIPGRTADVARGSDVTVILVAGPIHYDILLPADPETVQAFAFLEDAGIAVRTADWLVVGWGSRSFYMQTGTYQDLDAGVVWDAANGDASVFRFDVAYGDWASAGVPVTISRAQLALLRGQVLQGLSRDDDGLPVHILGAGLTGTDVFFEAQSRFSILRTCNVWIGEVLRGAGVKMGVWTPTPYAVTLSRWWFG